MVIFIDNILVNSKNGEEHAKHLRIMLQTLWLDKFYAKLSKCEFWLKSISYLGRIVSGEGISINPNKVQAVKDLSIPKLAIDIKRFIVLAGYYRRFVQDFSKITAPLKKLTRKGE